jgi:cytochrome c
MRQPWQGRASRRQPALLQCVEAVVPASKGANAKEIMKLRITPALCWVAAAVAAPAVASPELAQQKTCMACHALDRKVVGPSYKDVAAKYAGQPGAVDKLAEKIVKGGVGVWGAVPMPANPKVSPAEAKQLAEWILGLK